MEIKVAKKDLEIKKLVKEAKIAADEKKNIDAILEQAKKSLDEAVQNHQVEIINLNN